MELNAETCTLIGKAIHLGFSIVEVFEYVTYLV